MRGAIQRLSPTAKTAVLSAGLAAVAATISLQSVRRHADQVFSSQPLLVVALTITFFLAEQFLVNVEFRRESHSLTFAGVPLAIGIMLLPVHQLVIARFIGSLIALVLQRINAEKAIYNTCAYVFEAAVSATAVQALVGSPVELNLVGIGVALACIAVGDQVMSILVMSVIRMHGGRLGRRDVTEVLAQALVLSIVATSFGAAVCLLMRDGVAGDILVLVLLVLAIVLYRSYAATTRRHQSLAMVHDFVADSVGADSLEDLARHCLCRIRQLLRCTTAELLVANRDPHDGGGDPSALSVVVTEDDSVVVSRSRPDASDWIRSKALHHGEPTLAARATKDGATQKWLAHNHARDALVVPLAPVVVGYEAGGVVTVLDRLGDTTTFTLDDLKLLQTLTSHLAISLRSTRLMERLSHDATHDSLTALANRACLSEKIGQAFAAQRDDVAVLLLDLDKFKEVNDVLGHDVGDRLLIVVAERLKACLPSTATIARLGGDEFAVLLVDLGPGALAAATAHAHRARAELSRPVQFEEALLAPEASVGVAVGRFARPEDLLRCADTAMYAAKNGDSDVAVYRVEMDRGRAERLALVADLRSALEAHSQQFSVVYQPKIDLHSGAVVSAEALVRWNHPTLGTVTPDRFIPLAETSGLIDSLTEHVLTQALRECRSWNDQGFDLCVAVNLSARNVTDAGLPDRVSRILSEAGLHPDRLILEITESTVMEEPDKAVAILRALSDNGITISLDDFGTGYSSLSYLQQLPVRELKIDRSFVAGLTGENASNASALIRSITALGESLNLSVVAEGIETEYQWSLLSKLGCHIGQGYLISRPLSTVDMREWLTDHHSSRLRLVGRPAS